MKKTSEGSSCFGENVLLYYTQKKSSLFCGKQKEIKAIDHFNFFFIFRNIQQTNSITLFDGSSRQKLCRFA
jgi:hypothetical protein